MSGGRAAAADCVSGFPTAAEDEVPTDHGRRSDNDDDVSEEMQDDALSDTLTALGLKASRPTALPGRGVFCTRQLDLREIKVTESDSSQLLANFAAQHPNEDLVAKNRFRHS